MGNLVGIVETPHTDVEYNVLMNSLMSASFRDFHNNFIKDEIKGLMMVVDMLKEWKPGTRPNDVLQRLYSKWKFRPADDDNDNEFCYALGDKLMEIAGLEQLPATYDNV